MQRRRSTEPALFPIALAEELARLQTELERLDRTPGPMNEMLGAATRRTLALVLQQLGNQGWFCDAADPFVLRYHGDWAISSVFASAALRPTLASFEARP